MSKCIILGSSFVFAAVWLILSVLPVEAALSLRDDLQALTTQHEKELKDFRSRAEQVFARIQHKRQADLAARDDITANLVSAGDAARLHQEYQDRVNAHYDQLADIVRQHQKRRELEMTEAHWRRVAELLEGRQEASPAPAEAARCELEGTWLFGPKGETWTFVRKADGTYGAQERGFGNATGTAVVNGDKMHLQFVVTLEGKPHKGEYRGSFSQDGTIIQATRHPDGAGFTFRRR